MGCEFENPAESVVRMTPRGQYKVGIHVPSSFVKPDVLTTGGLGHRASMVFPKSLFYLLWQGQGRQRIRYMVRIYHWTL